MAPTPMPSEKKRLKANGRCLSSVNCATAGEMQMAHNESEIPEINARPIWGANASQIARAEKTAMAKNIHVSSENRMPRF